MISVLKINFSFPLLIKTQTGGKMAKNNFEEINFQHYVDAVKQKRIEWNMFIDFIQDLSHSDRERLRILNAILLTELTMNYSDLEKFKYLNVMLLREFKNHIQKEDTTLEMTQMEEFEKSEEEPEIDQLLNEETTDEEMEIAFVNEIEDDLIQDLDYKCRSCG